MKNIVLKLTFILMTFSPAFGADENIDMLNRLGKEINVYSKKIVNLISNLCKINSYQINVKGKTTEKSSGC